MGALRGLESQLGHQARAMACFLARGELGQTQAVSSRGGEDLELSLAQLAWQSESRSLEEQLEFSSILSSCGSNSEEVDVHILF